MASASKQPWQSRDAFVGLILGTAVGDSIGLPREGLSRRRAERLFGTGALRQRLVFGCGLVSDDTEHTCMAAQAWLAARGDVDAFAASLAWRFRGWLAALPAGVGKATLISTLRLWMGWSWRSSGIHSAGNGPAMRAGILGLMAGDNDELLRALVRCSTRITHTDPLAEQGALLVALAARHAARSQGSRSDPQKFFAEAMPMLPDGVMGDALIHVQEALARGDDARGFAAARGLDKSVSGYVLHTVPVCLFCWLRYREDYRRGIESVVCLGGDTDTTAAIVGGLIGASLGPAQIPAEWLDRLIEWPRTRNWMIKLGDRLSAVAQGELARPLPLFWPGLVLRNLVFLPIVLAHGFRRCLPPY